jgi:hypothetical protein
MIRRALTILLASAGAACALLAIAAVEGCGPSQLSKDYAAYDTRVEAILERELAVWKKLEAVLNEQAQAENPDAERFRAVVTGESVPFYDEMKRDVAAAAPAQTALGTAHETLVKYADRRATFAHLLAGNLDVLSHGDPWQSLVGKDNALQSAMNEYAQLVQGKPESQDQRFSLVQTALKDFQRLCVEPLGAGRLTAAQMAEIVKSQIQPKIREARGTQFEDDDQGRAVRAALVTADEFFDAVQQSAALMESSARLKRDTEALAKECDDLFLKFREEMKAVRGRM